MNSQAMSSRAVRMSARGFVFELVLLFLEREEARRESLLVTDSPAYFSSKRKTGFFGRSGRLDAHITSMRLEEIGTRVLETFFLSDLKDLESLYVISVGSIPIREDEERWLVKYSCHVGTPAQR